MSDLGEKPADGIHITAQWSISIIGPKVRQIHERFSWNEVGFISLLKKKKDLLNFDFSPIIHSEKFIYFAQP